MKLATLQDLALDAAREPKTRNSRQQLFFSALEQWLWERGRMVPSYSLVKAVVWREPQNVKAAFLRGI